MCPSCASAKQAYCFLVTAQALYRSAQPVSLNSLSLRSKFVKIIQVFVRTHRAVLTPHAPLCVFRGPLQQPWSQ